MIASGDADLVDEGLDQGLLRRRFAGGDRFLDPSAEGVELGLGRCLQRLVDHLGELCGPVPQLTGGVGEVTHSRAADSLGEIPGFEGPQVAVDGGFGLGQLGSDGVAFRLVVTPVGGVPGRDGGDRLVEQVGVLVGAQQRVQDRLVDLLGG
ncbi:MAG: hypothetical protein L0Y54_15890 [Sporichthyaceae bacterium]|nr:hypothetical protein [Sporichthyaceae bacterium]